MFVYGVDTMLFNFSKEVNTPLEHEIFISKYNNTADRKLYFGNNASLGDQVLLKLRRIMIEIFKI